MREYWKQLSTLLILKPRRQDDWINIHGTSPALNRLVYLCSQRSLCLLTDIHARCLTDAWTQSREKDGELFQPMWLRTWAEVGPKWKVKMKHRVWNATAVYQCVDNRISGTNSSPHFPSLSSLPLLFSMHHLSMSKQASIYSLHISIGNKIQQLPLLSQDHNNLTEFASVSNDSFF